MPQKTGPLGFLAPRYAVLLRYLAATAVLNLVWEILQLPLYTLWQKSSVTAIAFAVVHCTAGDVLIAFFALLVALALARAYDWPARRYGRVAAITCVLGLGYTVFSEWNNTIVTRSWEYSSYMPQVWGIGLSPVAQWIIIPSLIFYYLFRYQVAPILGNQTSTIT
jgi:hypothetical protein